MAGMIGKSVTMLALAVLMMVAGMLATDYVPCGTKTGRRCRRGFCCNYRGLCGVTDAYCAPGNCESQCDEYPYPPSPSPSSAHGGVADLITSELFEEMVLLGRNDSACPAKGFYTYSAFLAAATAFPTFGTQGDQESRKRELAAFFAQSSHETTGGRREAQNGNNEWGYCFKEVVNGENGADYCRQSGTCPCSSGKKYYGRGPMQLLWNYHYCACGQALGLDLLKNPDLVASDAVVSFKAAIWSWMTRQPPKPSCHDVMVGSWEPNTVDVGANRCTGFGVTTNVINGELECGVGKTDSRQDDRIGLFKRYCDMLGVSYGDNVDCSNQHPFNWSTAYPGSSAASALPGRVA